jgi:hypothetical protein
MDEWVAVLLEGANAEFPVLEASEIRLTVPFLWKFKGIQQGASGP